MTAQLKRRGFLQMLAASPAVIKSTAEAQIFGPATNSVGIGFSGHAALHQSESAALDKIKTLLKTDASFLKRIIEAEIADMQHETALNNPNNWPATVQAKRSWSYAAKRNEAIRLEAERRAKARIPGFGTQIGNLMETFGLDRQAWWRI